MFVEVVENVILGLGHGAEALGPSRWVGAIVPCFAPSDEECSDTSIHVLDNLCLTAGRLAEVPNTPPGAAQAVSTGCAWESASSEVRTKGGSEGSATALSDGFANFSNIEGVLLCLYL